MKTLHFSGSIKKPKYAFDAGCDIELTDDLVLKPGDAVWVKTDVTVSTPLDCFSAVVAKSSTLKRGISVAPSIIDTTYDSTIHYLLINHSTYTYNFAKGDSLAQLVVIKIYATRIFSYKPFNKFKRQVVKWLSNIIWPSKPTRYTK